MRVAFVYDRVNKFGGAERVLLALKEIWPLAPLFTAVYDPKAASWAKSFKVIPSFVNFFPLAKSFHEIYPWLTPLAFESFNFDSFDLVISVTSSDAKGIITKPKTKHICYCLTPTRYLWSLQEEYQKNPGFGIVDPIVRSILKEISPSLGKWDLIASSRPDKYLAISQAVSDRIKKYYGKESEVIYPPVDIEKFKLSRRQINEKYFLLVSRLVSYKKTDLAVKVFSKLGYNLTIIGKGREEKRLKKIAGKNIKFVHDLTEQELLSYYQSCQALIFPQEEDFGIVSVEAQAAGKPVIAFKKGGAMETIIEGVTGEFFYPQEEKSLYDVVKAFDPKKYNPGDCRKNAERFSKDKFKNSFIERIQKFL